MSSTDRQQRLLSPFSRSLDSSHWPTISLELPLIGQRQRSARSPLSRCSAEPDADEEKDALVSSESEGALSATTLFGSPTICLSRSSSNLGPCLTSSSTSSCSSSFSSSTDSPSASFSSFGSLSRSESGHAVLDSSPSIARQPAGFSSSADSGLPQKSLSFSELASPPSTTGSKYPSHLVKGGPLVKSSPNFGEIQSQLTRSRGNSADRQAFGTRSNSHVGFMNQASRSGNDLGRLATAMEVEKPKPLLPTVAGEQPDLWYITGEVMIRLLRNEFSTLFDRVIVLDCRYDYEYQGGHLRGALSVPRLERVREIFLSPAQACHRTALIFHCEFSSKRGPRCLRELRDLDRKANGTENYPHLYYPHCYLLKGGYRKFYEEHKSPEFCEPCGYIEMYDKRFADQLKASRWDKKSQKSQRRDWRSKSFSGVPTNRPSMSMRALRLATSTEEWSGRQNSNADGADEGADPTTPIKLTTSARGHSSYDSYVTLEPLMTPRPSVALFGFGDRHRAALPGSDEHPDCVAQRGSTSNSGSPCTGRSRSHTSNGRSRSHTSNGRSRSGRGSSQEGATPSALSSRSRAATLSQLNSPMSPQLSALGRTLSATTISSPSPSHHSPRPSRRHRLVYEENSSGNVPLTLTAASSPKTGGSWCAGMRRSRMINTDANHALRRTRARNKLTTSSVHVPTAARTGQQQQEPGLQPQRQSMPLPKPQPSHCVSGQPNMLATQTWATRSLETISELPMMATTRW
eukprot:CAMPEP_0177645880 /NCGR_PEP_ID=MMETSP0447-20121125/9481_1 /TAXON_ID=0 /ORGANISM="Stygamoeba regulata, Strain BSH-02190019" /LENGTH=744 /DNA_ID=CAMNT_0019148385 /DNA_START=370 /DNA_END=2604 /DNA_ORIENTATION=-